MSGTYIFVHHVLRGFLQNTIAMSSHFPHVYLRTTVMAGGIMGRRISGYPPLTGHDKIQLVADNPIQSPVKGSLYGSTFHMIFLGGHLLKTAIKRPELNRSHRQLNKSESPGTEWRRSLAVIRLEQHCSAGPQKAYTTWLHSFNEVRATPINLVEKLSNWWSSSIAKLAEAQNLSACYPWRATLRAQNTAV
jgi:hypothetical protein